ncbi:J domain-containing protein [Photobacterium sp. 1_MG-2023]|uniref:J domain-containing protein n=1 Tax=Photobacterium sp. 1_MG-2023 TaxID=3062646 RepID=UPI0026E3346A|nr:J domain-containing protein [Photobacterium sp. 1_MG-2023]MDO6705608.1 J domain-containing protein [Photobacterium sp. 1_MG-2023]
MTMSCWDILEISQTTDEKAIQKAYRIKLRQHHPEDDPEGFQTVRAAYEAAIASLETLVKGQDNAPVQPILDDAEVVPLAPDAQTNRGREDSPHELITSLQQLLIDPHRRFQAAEWQNWIDAVQVLPITQQQEISDATVTMVMNNRWLPGEIIELLWHGLSWELLLSGTTEQSEQGEFLEDWRQQALSITLSHLDAMSGAEQRAVLSFLRPFHLAMGYGEVAALKNILSQPMATSLIASVTFRISLLKGFLACQQLPETLAAYLVHQLLEADSDTLTLGQWEILGEVSHKLGDLEAVHRVSERLLALNAFAEVAELQYQQTVPQNRLLALCYGFLRQQWQPLPQVYWRAERQLFPQPESDPESRLFLWLYGQLTGHDHPGFSHRLDFAGMTGIEALLTEAFWAGRFGSWAWLAQIQQKLNAIDIALPEHKYAVELTKAWVQQQCNLKAGSESLQQKLALYETDAFFQVEPLTDQEFESLSQAQWLDCLIRHPLLPDAWFHKFTETGILTQQALWDANTYPAYVDSLNFFRCVNPDFRLASCWQDAPFQGVFDWALFYYGHMSPVGTARQSMIDALPLLPAEQQQGPMSKLLPFAASPDTFLPDAVQALNEFPEQFVYRTLVDDQVTLLTRTCDQAQLLELAQTGEMTACCALSRVLAKDHFDEAIVFWNLTAAALRQHPHFLDVVSWQQQSLIRLREEKGLDQENYRVTEPTFLYAMLTRDKDWFIPPVEMADHSPVDEAKNFHYPMYHLLTQLHLGLGEKGYDLSPLKHLAYSRKAQTALQQATADIAIIHLEQMYQHKLTHDIQLKGKQAASFSRRRLQWLAIFFFMSWLLFFTPTFFEADGLARSQIAGVSLLAYQVLLFVCHSFVVWRIGQPVIERRNRMRYAGYATFVLIAALWTKSPVLALINLITHWFTARGLTQLYGNGGWEKKVVQKRTVNLRKLLGMKEKNK